MKKELEKQIENRIGEPIESIRNKPIYDRQLEINKQARRWRLWKWITCCYWHMPQKENRGLYGNWKCSGCGEMRTQ